MIKLENSDVVKQVLDSLVKITSKKTSESHAYLTVSLLVRDLEKKYDFLKYVNIKNNQEEIFIADKNINYNLDIYPDINYISDKELGKAIQELVDVLHENLGKKGGYFFIREFRELLGKDYHYAIKDMGVDLRLSELQKELYGISSEDFEIKDEDGSNIAYLEKK